MSLNITVLPFGDNIWNTHFGIKNKYNSAKSNSNTNMLLFHISNQIQIHFINTLHFFIQIQFKYINIIYPNTPYIEALANAQLTSLKQRRAQLCEHFFTQIEQPQHKLHKLLPKPRTITYTTRCRTRYSLPRVKTNRTKNCFINWCLLNQKNSQWLLKSFRACWYGYV